ncbi:MAG: hypothetical protein HZC54_03980 [Verrucomicrobia bacterium]|nr:hypothetical protein [Verrucomicrobiota bacterium]
MPKNDIGWKRRTPDGERVQVYAHPVGTLWNFYTRGGRYEEWQFTPQPPLEDWLALLDGVDRLVARDRMPAQEADRLRRTIRERFPDAGV